MKIAFLILAHKNPEQLKLLVEKLQHKESVFFIHIDKNVEIKPFKNQLNNYTNIHWIKREKGRWGDIGIVKATLNCLKAAYNLNDKISHFVLLSGQDYPILKIEEVLSFFSQNLDKSFIEHNEFPIESLNYSGLDRLNCYSYNLGKKRITAIPLSWKPRFNFKGHVLNIFMLAVSFFRNVRKHPNHVIPYYGSQWWVLNYSLCQKVLNFIENNPQFLKYHRSTLLPDEIVIQSICGTLKKKNTEIEIDNENLHYIDWSKKSSHPKNLTEKDFDKIKKSNKIFARKFEYPSCKTLINKLNEQI